MKRLLAVTAAAACVALAGCVGWQKHVVERADSIIPGNFTYGISQDSKDFLERLQEGVGREREAAWIDFPPPEGE